MLLNYLIHTGIITKIFSHKTWNVHNGGYNNSILQIFQVFKKLTSIESLKEILHLFVDRTKLCSAKFAPPQSPHPMILSKAPSSQYPPYKPVIPTAQVDASLHDTYKTGQSVGGAKTGEPREIRAVAGQRSSPDLYFATKFIKIYDP